MVRDKIYLLFNSCDKLNHSMNSTYVLFYNILLQCTLEAWSFHPFFLEIIRQCIVSKWTDATKVCNYNERKVVQRRGRRESPNFGGGVDKETIARWASNAWLLFSNGLIYIEGP